MKRNVAWRLVELLRSYGIRHVFGVPSGDWLPYLEAMEEQGVDFVLVANEASAGFMATVYGWMTGTPGACYGTYGPGATNLSTGVGCAYLDRSPVLAFTSENPDSMVGRTQQMMIDHQTLMRPITKWTTRLNPANMDQSIARAIRISTSEYPGPTHIGLPGGVGEADAPSSQISPVPFSRSAPPDGEALKRMEAVFSTARKPVIAVGLSAVRADVGHAVAAAAERHSIPVVLTPMAKGLLSEKHPAYAGVLMHALSDRVAETYRSADLVVGIGYDPVEFNYEEWMPEVGLVHIDTEPADIDGCVYGEVLNVVGDISAALGRLIEIDPIRSVWDMNEIAGRRAAIFEALTPEKGSFGPLAAVSILREVLPDEGIMTCDVGAHTHLIGQAWRTPWRYGQIMTNGWSSMGFGVPAAIAAKIAEPGRPVVCVTGDGGFMMMAGEMATAKRLGLPIVFVVLKDRTLGLIRIKQGKRGQVTDDTLLCTDEECSTGYQFGVPVLSADDANSYRSALEKAFESPGPTIVEAKIETTEYESTILRRHR